MATSLPFLLPPVGSVLPSCRHPPNALFLRTIRKALFRLVIDVKRAILDVSLLISVLYNTFDPTYYAPATGRSGPV